MGIHRVGGSLAGQRPVGVVCAEVVDHVGVVAAVDEGQPHHHRLSAVLPVVLEVHDPLHLREGVRLPVGDILRGEIVPPCPDGPVDAVLLNVYASGQELRPFRDGQLRQVRLALQHQVRIRFQFRILPRLRQPAVREVLKEVRVILACQEGFHDLRKADEGGIKGVDPEGHFPCELGVFLDHPPLPVAEHLRLVPVCDHALAFLADVNGELRPVCVAHALIAGEVDLLPFQLYHLAAVWAWHKVVLHLVRCFHGFPDVPGLERGGAGDVDLPVAEGLSPLPGQRDRVRLLLRGSWIFVHLIKEQVSDGPAGQLGRAVGADHIQEHSVKLQLRLGGDRVPEPLSEGF